MQPNFAANSRFNKDSNFVGIKYSDGTPVLASEDMESVDIQNYRRRELAKSIFNNGIDDVEKVVWVASGGGVDVTISNAMFFVEGESIHVESLTKHLEDSEDLYLVINQVVVTNLDVIKKLGNQQTLETIANEIVDPAIGQETTRRFQLTLDLSTTLSGNEFGSVLIGGCVGNDFNVVVDNFVESIKERIIGDTSALSGTVIEDINSKYASALSYTDQQIILITESGIPKLNVYTYPMDGVLGQNVFGIPLLTFDKSTDTVRLFINSTYKEPSEYVVGGVVGSGNITLNIPLEEPSRVVVEVWKNIPMGESGSVSGVVIAQETMPPNRVIGLTNELEKLNNLESFIKNSTNNGVSMYELLKMITVTDSYASPSDLTVGGASLYNNVINGDFSNGTTGWIGSAALLSVENKILSVNNNGISPFVKAYKSINGGLRSGDKWFVRARARVLHDVCISLRIQFGEDSNYGYIVDNLLPVQNTWHELSGIITITTQSELRISIVQELSTLATGKVMEVDGNVGVFAIPITGTSYENYTVDQMNALVNKYFEGLQGAKEVVVGSRGKNLFDGNLQENAIDITTGGNVTLIGYGRTDFIVAKANAKYYFKYDNKTPSYRWFAYDQNKRMIATNTVTSEAYFTTPSNTRYIRFSSSDFSDLELANSMLNEGTTALPYEPYQGSQTTISATRHKLPNLVEDELKFVDGKWVFVKRTAEYFMKSTDIEGLSVGSNTTRAYTSTAFLTGHATWTAAIDVNVILGNYIELDEGTENFDLVSNIGKFYVGSDGRMWIIIANGLSLAQAQTALAGTKIVYELAIPLTIEEKDFAQYGITVDGSLSSNLDYTEYFVADHDIMADVDITYATNLAKAVEQLKDASNGLREAVDGKASKVWGETIFPTLLNGWSTGGYYCEYSKNSAGLVSIRFLMQAGIVTPGTIVFNVPAEFIPYRFILIPTLNNGTGSQGHGLYLESSGALKVANDPNFATGQLVIGEITFKAVYS